MTRPRVTSGCLLLALAAVTILGSGCARSTSKMGTADGATATTIATASRPVTPLPPLTNATDDRNPPAGDSATVTRVYDGDTVDVELDGRVYRLRYIGVDSPERDEPFYEEAVDFNRNLVEDQIVVLVKDVSETDQYGRLLRYVYLPDGTFVNAALIRGGMARLVTFPPDVAQTDYLRDLQDQARADGVGMWSRPDRVGPCDCDRNLYDCRDFRSREEAQSCFAYCLATTGRDVHNLDGGGDGYVCESLP